MSYLQDKAIFYLVVFIRSVLRLFDPQKSAAFLAKFAYFFDKKHIKIVKANLRFCFADLSDEKIEQICQKTYQNFARYFVEFLLSDKTDQEKIKSKVSLKNEQIIKKAKKENKKIILVSAHFCNFELMINYVGRYVTPISIVREKLYNSPSLSQELMNYVSRGGIIAHEKKGAIKSLIKDLRANRAIALATDQNTGEKDASVVQFFGHNASHTSSASRLAKMFNALIIPVFVRQKASGYEIEFFEPISPELSIQELTQAQADITQRLVSENIDEYFWFHRRFKSHHKEIYQ